MLSGVAPTLLKGPRTMPRTPKVFVFAVFAAGARPSSLASVASGNFGCASGRSSPSGRDSPPSFRIRQKCTAMRTRERDRDDRDVQDVEADERLLAHDLVAEQQEADLLADERRVARRSRCRP